MTPKEPDSKDFLSNALDHVLKINTWRKLVMFIVLSTWIALIWDFAINKGQIQREYFTSFVGASKRPVLFAEDYTFINNLLKKYPEANISVIEVNYLAGIASKPLNNLNTTDKIVLNKAGIPIAAILMSPETPAEAKAEILRYFKGNDNISPVVPLTPNTNGQLNTPSPLPSRSPLVIPRGD